MCGRHKNEHNRQNAKKHNGQILEHNRHKPIADQMNKPLKHCQCTVVIKIP